MSEQTAETMTATAQGLAVVDDQGQKAPGNSESSNALRPAYLIRTVRHQGAVRKAAATEYCAQRRRAQPAHAYRLEPAGLGWKTPAAKMNMGLLGYDNQQNAIQKDRNHTRH